MMGSDDQRPSVAVIIAAYNGARTVGRAVESALLQRDVGAVIVVDDCSADETLEAARAADDGSGRLTTLRQAKNGGPAAARNAALDRVTDDFMTVLDADDYMLPGRIDRLLAAADGADLVADDMYQVPAPDAPVGATLLDGSLPLPTPVSLADFILSNVTRAGSLRKELGFIKPLIRMSLLRNAGVRYDESMRLGEDFDLYCRLMAAGGRLRLVPAAGYVAVTRPDSLSARHTIHDLEQFRRSNRNLRALPGLTPEVAAALDAHYTSVDCRLQWRRMIEAVKARDVRKAMSTFTSVPVGLFVAQRLLEQLVVRSAALVDRRVKA